MIPIPITDALPFVGGRPERSAHTKRHQDARHVCVAHFSWVAGICPYRTVKRADYCLCAARLVVLLMAIEAYLPIEDAFSIEKGILGVLAWGLLQSLRHR